MSSKSDLPTYYSMIQTALIKLNEKSGNKNKLQSAQKINSYIKENFAVPDKFKGYVRRAMKRAVKDDNIVQVRRSYRFASLSLKAKQIANDSNAKTSIEVTVPSPTTPEIGLEHNNSSIIPEVSSSLPKSEQQSHLTATITSPTTAESIANKIIQVTKKQKESREKIVNSRRKTILLDNVLPRLPTVNISSPVPVVPVVPTAPIIAPRSSSNLLKNSKEALAILSKNSIKNSHLWQYNFEGCWKNYDFSASDTVESVYQGYLANRGDTDVRAVKSGEFEYMVDFMAMKQTNLVHPNHTIRDIRRIAVNFM